HEFASLEVDQARLYRAGTHREDRVELVAGAEDRLAGSPWADVLDQAMQLAQRDLVDSAADADRPERAGGAELLFVAVVGNRIRPHDATACRHAVTHSTDSARALTPRANSGCPGS